MISEQAKQAMRDHARQEHPKESCGFVIDGTYYPVPNVHDNPTEFFRVEGNEWIKAKAKGRIELFVHSHPDGPLYPSEADMAAQVASCVPWAIIATDGELTSEPIIWGADAPELLGRKFVHGITDCYSLIRDTFAAGKEGLKAQGVSNEWPFDPILLPEVPREDGWWNMEGKDLYQDHFAKFGFEIVPMTEAKTGDVFLASIRSDKLNHGGVLVESDLMMHHLPNRVSRREPAGLWARQAELWIRYTGAANA